MIILGLSLFSIKILSEAFKNWSSRQRSVSVSVSHFVHLFWYLNYLVLIFWARLIVWLLLCNFVSLCAQVFGSVFGPKPFSSGAVEPLVCHLIHSTDKFDSKTYGIFMQTIHNLWALIKLCITTLDGTERSGVGLDCPYSVFNVQPYVLCSQAWAQCLRAGVVRHRQWCSPAVWPSTSAITHSSRLWTQSLASELERRRSGPCLGVRMQMAITLHLEV